MEEKARALETHGAIRKPIDLDELLAVIERFNRNARHTSVSKTARMNQRSRRWVRLLYGNVELRGRAERRQPPEQRVVLDDRFEAAELAQALGPVAEADAARLDAAQRRLDEEVVHQRVVHAHAARLQPPRERARARRVARPDAARQARGRVVGRRAAPPRRPRRA